MYVEDVFNEVLKPLCNSSKGKNTKLTPSKQVAVK